MQIKYLLRLARLSSKKMKIMKNLQAQAAVVVVPAPVPAQAIVSLNPAAAIKSMNLHPNMIQVIKMILVIRTKSQFMNLLPAPPTITTLGSKQLTCFLKSAPDKGALSLINCFMFEGKGKGNKKYISKRR